MNQTREVMRDKADNCVIICSIENFDPMGVHTGDSITVAPIQTLTDKEFQIMRDQSFAVSQYAGARKRRDLEMVEFWKADVEDKLRRVSLIFDDGK